MFDGIALKVVVLLSALDFLKLTRLNLVTKKKLFTLSLPGGKQNISRIRENNAKYILQHDQDQTHAFLTTNRLQSCQIGGTTLLTEPFG